MNNQSFSSTATSITTNLIDHDHIDDDHGFRCDDDGEDNESGISHDTSLSQTKV